MLFLIPLLPFAGFLVNTAFRRQLSKTASGAIATGAMGLAFGVAVSAVVQMLGVEPVDGVRAIESSLYSWFASDTLRVPVSAIVVCNSLRRHSIALATPALPIAPSPQT